LGIVDDLQPLLALFEVDQRFGLGDTFDLE
jgi:hypothetical protein